MEVPVHASSSGVITSIELHTVAHPSGLSNLVFTSNQMVWINGVNVNPWPDFHRYDAIQLFDRIVRLVLLVWAVQASRPMPN